MRAAFLIASLDLRRRFRDRSLLVQAIVGPVVLAIIISFAFGGFSGFDARIGVVDEDGSSVSQGFVTGLINQTAGDLEFRPASNRTEARDQVDDDDLDAAIVVPEGFGDSLATDQPLSLQVYTAADRPVSGGIAEAVAAGFADRLDAGRLAIATAVSAGAEPTPALAQQSAAIELPARVEVGGGGEEYNAGSFFGPGIGMVFLFLTVGMAARSLLAEQREGMLARIRAAPITDTSILAGKTASVLVLGLVSMLVIWLVTMLVLGADWGDPAGVLALIIAVVLAVAGIASLIAALARTDQSADALTNMVAFVFAIVGGNFVGPGNLPGALRQVSLATPNGWALRGFTELGAADANLVDIVPNLAVLMTIAAITGAVALLALRRRIGR